jgi:hypothetical protein
VPAAPQGHGGRRARSSDGATHLARQRTVSERHRVEGRADDLYRHAYGQAASKRPTWQHDVNTFGDINKLTDTLVAASHGACACKQRAPAIGQ